MLYYLFQTYGFSFLFSRKDIINYPYVIQDKNYISDFSDSIIYIINYVIDELTKNPLLLKFISKNLSWGVFNKTVLNLYDNSNDEEEFSSIQDIIVDFISMSIFT